MNSVEFKEEFLKDRKAAIAELAAELNYFTLAGPWLGFELSKMNELHLLIRGLFVEIVIKPDTIHISATTFIDGQSEDTVSIDVAKPETVMRTLKLLALTK